MNRRNRPWTTSGLLLFCLACCAHTGAGELSYMKAKDALRAYWKADPAKRTAVIEALGENDVLARKRDVEKLAQAFLKDAARQKPKPEPVDIDVTAKLSAQRKMFNKRLGIGTAPVLTLPTPNGDMRVILLQPKKSRKPVAAVVYLHGGGGGADENEMAWGWGLVRATKIDSAPIKIIPRCVDDGTVNSWVRPPEAQNVEAALNRLLRYFEIDPDRVYLLGISMGGFGAWQFASYSADRYAAIASNGGGSTLAGRAYENLRNLPFGVFIGEKDTKANRLAYARKGRDAVQALKKADAAGYPLLYKEYPGVGHMTPDNVYADMDAFFKQHKREAYPRTVVWAPQVGWKKRFYNLALNAPTKGMRIHATMGQDNVVTIRSDNVTAMTLYLNDALADLDKEVTVRWNDREAFRGTVPRRLSVLVETLATRFDAGMAYSGKVELAMPAQ